jgi:hypothetical protein
MMSNSEQLYNEVESFETDYSEEAGFQTTCFGFVATVAG